MKVCLNLCLMVLLLSGIVGCNSVPIRDPNYSVTRPVMPATPPRATGSIYHSGHGISWFEDLRARRVGDMLTIKLVEKTDASKQAKTNAKHANTNNVTNPTLFGSTPQFNLPSWVPLADHKKNTLQFGLSSDSDFSGEGDSAQSNKLSGELTVTVTEVLPNGYLVIRGEKRIGINQGTEYLKLSGIVRPYDIDSNNSVESNRIADLTIVYTGDGAVADSNAMGWLSRFFVSEIFPF